MLSSICEQTHPELVTVDIAFLVNNGAPSTEEVIAFYGRMIDIRGSAYSDTVIFQKRGNTRNQQLIRCSTEWLLFADCDMTYHPDYFARLADELFAKHAGASYMLSAGRRSATKESANALVDQFVLRPVALIPEVFRQSAALPARRKSNVGAGFSQLVNVRHAPHGGIYVDPVTNPDWAWDTRYHKTRSDIQFRRRMARLGGERRSLPRWFTNGLIHLNHDRDKEVGYHLETQR